MAEVELFLAQNGDDADDDEVDDDDGDGEVEGEPKDASTPVQWRNEDR